jgi:hypothetical protein
VANGEEVAVVLDRETPEAALIELSFSGRVIVGMISQSSRVVAARDPPQFPAWPAPAQE